MMTLICPATFLMDTADDMNVLSMLRLPQNTSSSVVPKPTTDDSMVDRLSVSDRPWKSAMAWIARSMFIETYNDCLHRRETSTRSATGEASGARHGSASPCGCDDGFHLNDRGALAENLFRHGNLGPKSGRKLFPFAEFLGFQERIEILYLLKLWLQE